MNLKRCILVSILLANALCELHLAKTWAGQVVAWGDNSASQTNVPLAALEAVAVAAGPSYGLALRPDGTVVSWPDGVAPAVPPWLDRVVAIAAGGAHCLALRDDGSVVAWGSNSAGQTNVPTGLSLIAAIAAGNDCSFAVRSNGTLAVWGGSWMNPATNVPSGLSNVMAVAIENRRGAALLNDGTLSGWGTSQRIPPGATNTLAIAAGYNHSLALNRDGQVIAWGYPVPAPVTNVPPHVSNIVAISAGRYHSLALQAGGTVLAWGSSEYGVTNVPADLSNVTAIAAGHTFNVALVLASVQFADAGAYTVHVTNAGGLTNAGPVALTVTLSSRRPRLQLSVSETNLVLDCWLRQETGSLSVRASGAPGSFDFESTELFRGAIPNGRHWQTVLTNWADHSQQYFRVIEESPAPGR